MTPTAVMEKAISDPTSERELIKTGKKKAIFGSAIEKELIKAGTHFFCLTCLRILPIEKQSDDPRFCRSCNGFLSQESEALNDHTSWWVPTSAGEKAIKKTAPEKSQAAHSTAHVPPVKGDIIPATHTHTSADQRVNMSTQKNPKNEVVITPPGEKARKRRGPKQKSLPVEDIKRWAEQEGIGSKRIAAKLEKERGIKVSYKTIQRILKGQRVMEL